MCVAFSRVRCLQRLRAQRGDSFHGWQVATGLASHPNEAGSRVGGCVSPVGAVRGWLRLPSAGAVPGVVTRCPQAAAGLRRAAASRSSPGSVQETGSSQRLPFAKQQQAFQPHAAWRQVNKAEASEQLYEKSAFKHCQNNVGPIVIEENTAINQSCVVYTDLWKRTPWPITMPGAGQISPPNLRTLRWHEPLFMLQKHTCLT